MATTLLSSCVGFSTYALSSMKSPGGFRPFGVPFPFGAFGIAPIPGIAPIAGAAGAGAGAAAAVSGEGELLGAPPTGLKASIALFSSSRIG